LTLDAYFFINSAKINGNRLIVMMFVAMLLLGWWEIRRSRRRFREAKQRLNTIYGDVKDQPDSEKSIQADILRESSQAVDSKTEKSH